MGMDTWAPRPEGRGEEGSGPCDCVWARPGALAMAIGSCDHGAGHPAELAGMLTVAIRLEGSPMPHKVEVGRLRGLPVRAESWELALGRLPVTAPVEPGGKQEPFVACVCVTETGEMCMADPQPERLASASVGVDAFTRLALDGVAGATPAVGYLPESVTIGTLPRKARDALGDVLRELGIRVELKTQTPRASAVLELLGEAMLGGPDAGPIDAPALMRAKGMTVERVAAFAEAAAAFWRAAPWELSGAEILWRIGPAPKTKGLTHVTVLGAAGQEYGLGFLAGIHEFIGMAEADDPGELFGTLRRTLWSVGFEERESIPEADVLLWDEHSLAVAADDEGVGVYPMAMGVSAKGKVVRPTAADLTVMEGVLRACAGMTEEDIERAELEAEVSTFEGVRRLRLEAAAGLSEG